MGAAQRPPSGRGAEPVEYIAFPSKFTPEVFGRRQGISCVAPRDPFCGSTGGGYFMYSCVAPRAPSLWIHGGGVAIFTFAKFRVPSRGLWEGGTPRNFFGGSWVFPIGLPPPCFFLILFRRVINFGPCPTQPPLSGGFSYMNYVNDRSMASSVAIVYHNSII